MNIGFVGLGKLGLPVALAVESKGYDVMGYDVNPDVAGYIERGEIPYQEEGLQPLLDETSLKVAHSIGEVVAHSDIVFLPVQTPHDQRFEGTAPLTPERADFNYSYLREAISAVALSAQEIEKPTTLAVISTCLPGTFERELRPVTNEWIKYVYTPQFIAMGTVLNDYLHPEFNLIGVDNEEAAAQLQAFYETINDAPSVVTDITTAEGIKVSYNTWITAKTVIANAWGEMAERLGMDFSAIKGAWDLSTKRLLSPAYTDAGVGDGGGCHPRDNIALSWLAGEVGMSHNIWDDLMLAREQHMEWLGDVAVEQSEESGLELIILGRSFKPETNIETGSPAILARELIKQRHGYEALHVEDLEHLDKAVYLLATRHERYKDYDFPEGSIVVDPFGFVEGKSGVKILSIGRTKA